MKKYQLLSLLILLFSIELRAQSIIDEISEELCDCIMRNKVKSTEEMTEKCLLIILERREKEITDIYGIEFLNEPSVSEKLGIDIMRKLIANCDGVVELLVEENKEKGVKEALPREEEAEENKLYNSFGRLRAVKGDYIHVLEHEEAGMVDDYYLLYGFNGDKSILKNTSDFTGNLLIWWYWGPIYSAKTSSVDNVRIVTDWDIIPQNDVCNVGNEKGKYYDYQPGVRKVMQTGDVYYTLEYDTTFLQRNGVPFLQRKTFNLGNVNTYLFTEKKDGMYYLESDSITLTLDLPAKPKKGQKWFDFDKSWEYEIVQLDATLDTPECSYQNCLAIRATYLKEKDADGNDYVYLNYYKKGFGFIGSKLNDSLVSFLVGFDIP